MFGRLRRCRLAARANILYDFITGEVVKQFGGHKDVQLRRSRGLLVVRIRNRVVLRFKKFTGKSLKASCNQNMQTVAFEQHQLELPQGSLQPITHLVAGYLLDELAAGLEKVAVTCSVDGKHFWAPIEITAATTGHTATAHNVVTTDPTATKPGVRSARRKKDPQPDTGE